MCVKTCVCGIHMNMCAHICICEILYSMLNLTWNLIVSPLLWQIFQDFNVLFTVYVTIVIIVKPSRNRPQPGGSVGWSSMVLLKYCQTHQIVKICYESQGPCRIAKPLFSNCFLFLVYVIHLDFFSLLIFPLWFVIFVSVELTHQPNVLNVLCAKTFVINCVFLECINMTISIQILKM